MLTRRPHADSQRGQGVTLGQGGEGICLWAELEAVWDLREVLHGAVQSDSSILHLVPGGKRSPHVTEVSAYTQYTRELAGSASIFGRLVLRNIIFPTRINPPIQFYISRVPKVVRIQGLPKDVQRP